MRHLASVFVLSATAFGFGIKALLELVLFHERDSAKKSVHTGTLLFLGAFSALCLSLFLDYLGH